MDALTPVQYSQTPKNDKNTPRTPRANEQLARQGSNVIALDKHYQRKPRGDLHQ